MIRVLILVILSTFVGANAFGQEPKPDKQRAPLLCPRLCPSTQLLNTKSNKVSKRIVFLDVPVTSLRKTVDIRRIKNGNLQLGTVLEPWEDKISFGPFSNLALGAYLGGTSVVLGGGFGKNTTEDTIRRTRGAKLEIDQSVWMVLFGTEGFIEQEKVSEISDTTGLSVNFARLSYGGKGWIGFKIGQFKDDFLAIKLGKGYVATEGERLYKSSSLLETVPFTIYFEDFDIESVSAEGRWRWDRFSLGTRADYDWYERRLISPDPYRYGKNKFEDFAIKGTLEIVPVLKFQTIRFLVRGQKSFFERSGLLFRNEDPNLQFILRIAF